MATFVLTQTGGVRLKNEPTNTAPAAGTATGSIVVETFDSPGEFLWDVPPFVSSVLVEVWGGGCPGEQATGPSAGAYGGGGGGYAAAKLGAPIITPGGRMRMEVGLGAESAEFPVSTSSRVTYDGDPVIEGEPGVGRNGGVGTVAPLPGVVVIAVEQGQAGSQPDDMDFGGAGGAGARGGAGGAGGKANLGGDPGLPGSHPGGGGGGAAGHSGVTEPGGKGANGRVRLRYLAPPPA